MTTKDSGANDSVTRREFVPATGAAAAFTLVPRHVLGGAGYRAPSDKLNIAGVGVGGMGANYLRNCETENIVALADCDDEMCARTAPRYPGAKTYRDYRVLLEKEKNIDAVVIGTPDHTHAVVASAAMRLGSQQRIDRAGAFSLKPASAASNASSASGRLALYSGSANGNFLPSTIASRQDSWRTPSQRAIPSLAACSKRARSSSVIPSAWAVGPVVGSVIVAHSVSCVSVVDCQPRSWTAGSQQPTPVTWVRPPPSSTSSGNRRCAASRWLLGVPAG